ncbi:hypothetical protein, partial [uncultured Bradyrhizobium sp.]|uniref:hypothetical protein n=1 Tax=uncultured Bradyrhizobium sp. TaxID=199684 RepID=UPI002609AB38
ASFHSNERIAPSNRGIKHDRHMLPALEIDDMPGEFLSALRSADKFRELVSGTERPLDGTRNRPG